jgi:hypothetical protein
MRTGILARYEIKTKMARSKDGNDSWTFDDTNIIKAISKEK